MEFDEIIHQSTRLRLMSALHPLAADERIDFNRLKSISGATDGNLGGHLATLEKAGYVLIEKDFVGRKPRTRVSLTRQGRRSFERHIRYLRDIVEGALASMPADQTK
jgi:DNA-binding MarR family transcriptional regulator